MHKFHKIAVIDDVSLPIESWAKIRQISELPIEIASGDPKTSEEAVKRAEGCDAALVSWRTPLDRNFFERCKGLRYIGMCCTGFSNPEESNVNLKDAKKAGIIVTNVIDY